jgi:hypothetical protein
MPLGTRTESQGFRIEDLLPKYSRETRHWGWISAMLADFPRRMPLSAFLRLVPMSLVVQVQGTSEEALRAPCDEILLASCPAAALTLCHLWLWSDEGSRVVRSTDVEACMHAMRVACALEHQRRLGLVRVHVEGEDRLTPDESGGNMTIEFNPAFFAAVRRLGRTPNPFEIQELIAQVMPQVLESGWADPAALMSD